MHSGNSFEVQRIVVTVDELEGTLIIERKKKKNLEKETNEKLDYVSSNKVYIEKLGNLRIDQDKLESDCNKLSTELQLLKSSIILLRIQML